MVIGEADNLFILSYAYLSHWAKEPIMTSSFLFSGCFTPNPTRHVNTLLVGVDAMMSMKTDRHDSMDSFIRDRDGGHRHDSMDSFIQDRDGGHSLRSSDLIMPLGI
nr:hypothetical protein Iba_chr09bCG6050 [Ipomoea batatas]GME21066.1 hypothetical protein Iba_scaffold26684CG0010 [Ipomoea batatas]